MKIITIRKRVQTNIAVVAAMAVLLAADQPYRSFNVRAVACSVEALADLTRGLVNEEAIATLAGRLCSLSNRAAGDVGIAIIHVETGRTVTVQGTRRLPLYSVFKLPLAIAVLKEVEESRLTLDQRVRVTPADVAPGAVANSELWRRPADQSVAKLIELAIVRSDNTASDKLLQLVGGPALVTQRMQALGFHNIEILYTTREFSPNRDRPNTGSAEDLARLLVQLQKGALLQPAQQTLLLGFMRRTMTGQKRLRGNLPASAAVADKTGTGEAGAATNDVGIITLPEGKGHLAIAVLLSGSRLSTAAQEELIAEIARAAYDAHSSHWK